MIFGHFKLIHMIIIVSKKIKPNITRIINTKVLQFGSGSPWHPPLDYFAN